MSHAVKQAKRYRYYMTRDRQPGTPAVWRVPAHDLEQLVIARMCRHLVDEREVDGDSSLGAHDDARLHNTSTASVLMEGSEIERTDIIQALVERIDVRRDCVELTLRPVSEEPTQILTAAATLIRSGRQTRLVPPGAQTSGGQIPDEGLVRLVANAHAARLTIAEASDQPVDVIAKAQGFSRSPAPVLEEQRRPRLAEIKRWGGSARPARVRFQPIVEVRDAKLLDDAVAVDQVGKLDRVVPSLDLQPVLHSPSQLQSEALAQLGEDVARGR